MALRKCLYLGDKWNKLLKEFKMPQYKKWFKPRSQTVNKDSICNHFWLLPSEFYDKIIDNFNKVRH